MLINKGLVEWYNEIYKHEFVGNRNFEFSGGKMMEENPIVFISYSHDSEEHKEWVKSLATRLRDNTAYDT